MGNGINSINGMGGQYSQFVGKKLKCKVGFHHYRYPTNKVHESGTFAIAILNLESWEADEIPNEIVLDTLDKNGRLVVSGNMPRLEPGVTYKLIAKLSMHKKYGLQYEIESISMDYDMSNPDDQRKFFEFFLTDSQIDMIFSKFDNPIEILKKRDLASLMEIKGIGPVTAAKICEKYYENIDNGRAYVELSSYGLTKKAIDKLIAHFGSPDVVVDIVKRNPYALIKLVRGYGWKKADSLALSQGMTRDCKERVMAFAQYKLEEFANLGGNSCISVGELVNNVCAECYPVLQKDAVAWIKEDLAGETDFQNLYEKIKAGDTDVKIPTFFYSATLKKIGLMSFRLTEKEILDNIKRLKEAEAPFKYDREVCQRIISDVEREQGYTYTHEQKQAIWRILDGNVNILTGSAGTGKSSTMKPLIRIFTHYGLEVSQCALSGRAASLLTEYTGLRGKTIHRLLRYIPDEERFGCNSKSPLPSDVVILDETSMVGEELFLSLISAIKTGAKLIMLGDIKQLPPMSVGNLLGDCIKSGYVPTSTLTIIQRQATDSGIIAQCIQICEGKSIVKNVFAGEEIRGNLKDFKLVCDQDADIVHMKALNEYKALLGKGISPNDIQLVVPQRIRGVNSCRQLNAEVQFMVNGKPTPKAISVECREKDQSFVVVYKPGDRIMIIRNNYHAKTIKGKEVAIFNGNMGHIVDIAPELMIISLEDDQDDIVLPRDEWNSIQHSWACTCHKLQGSQAPYVIVVMDSSSFTLLNREWLYTALTRARKYCVLVGQPHAINTATRTSDVKIKQTWLQHDLRSMFLQEHGIGVGTEGI